MKTYVTRALSFILSFVILISLVSCSKQEDKEKAAKIAKENAEKYGDYDSTGQKYDCHLPDYIDLCKYKGIEVPDIPLVPSEDDIDNRMKHIESLYCPREQDPDRGAIEGDVVEICTSCRFSDTGETYNLLNFPEGSDGKGQAFVLGTNYFYTTAIDDAVVGMKAEETKTVTFNLPDPYYKDYYNSGAGLIMDIKLLYIDEIDYSVVNDDFFYEHVGYSMAEEREQVRNDLVKELTNLMDGYKVMATWNYICDNSKLISVPEKEKKQTYDNKKNSDRASAEKAELNLLDYIKQTYGIEHYDAYEEYLEQYVNDKCYEEMLLYYIMRLEDLKMTDEFYETNVLEMVKDFQIQDVTTAEDFLDYYYGLDNVKESLMKQYVQEWIADNSVPVKGVKTIYNNELNK